MNLVFKRKLPIPQEVKEMYPISEEGKLAKEKNDEEIKAVFEGKSDKFILIIGPCSADREDAVMDYLHRLRKVYEQVKDVFVIIPRIYTNKPRTNGSGYKGMLHQPDINDEENMLKGLIAIRKLHMRAINETGFSCADEMLYPENHRYLSDLLSYVAVGARSSEDQQHRMTASGLNVPAGMKNPTSGDLNVMMNSIKAGQMSHEFIYRGWEVESKGNPLCHAILRGSVNKKGASIPNYHYEDLIYCYDKYMEAKLQNPAVIIDCNHANSNKQYLEQIRIAKEVMHSIKHNEQIRSIVKGLMIESYLVDGKQKEDGCVYGQSVTDPCLGWEKTEKLILELADIRRDLLKK